MKKPDKTTDMTKGPILGPMILFILPLIGGSIFQQLYNTVDFLFVGNFLDRTSAAAVGAGSTLINCIIGLFTGLSVGCSVVMAQYIGAKKNKRAERVMHVSVTFGIIAGAVLLAAGEIFAPQLLTVLNTPESVLPQATTYIRLYLLSLPMLIFYNMITGAFRAAGDSRTPFIVLAVCGLMNVGFDALFILVIKMGVAGVAIATTATQGMSALIIGILMSRKNREIRLSFRKLCFDTGILKKVLRIGLPTGVQTIIITISNVIVQYYINGYGERAVAAFATYYKVENLIYLVILAVGQASTTFAAQNMGADNTGRIKKGTVVINVFGAAVTAAISGMILLFPSTVFGWFMKDAQVAETAISLAMVSFPFYAVYSVLEVTGGAVRGMGYSISSMVCIIVNLCVVRIGLLAIISETFDSVQSLAAAYPITWAFAALSFVIIFIIIIKRTGRDSKTLIADTL